MMTVPWRYLVRSATVLLAGLAVACQSSDVVAPDGATISLTANPATIVLTGGVQAQDVTIVATVSNSIGVPLSGQDVRFTTTAGTLTPQAGTPVRTGGDGNATTVLSAARQPPTITAKSGKATQTLQIQTATCTLNRIVLSPSPLLLNTCNDTFTLSAVATDTNGAVCPGLLITFAASGSSSSTDVIGSLNPSSDTTDGSGVATTLLTISSTDCNGKCVGKTCTGSFRATAGTTNSNDVLISDLVN